MVEGKKKGKRKRVPKVQLERVIGLVSKSNATFDRNPITGDIAYVSGCIVVVYSPHRNTQTKFLRTKGNKAINCIRWDSKGMYLAAGEVGHQPVVTVWDVKTEQIQCELKIHRFGVAAIAFSPNGKYLVSVGTKHDNYLYVWNWRSSTPLRCNKVSGEVLCMSFAQDGSYFVTAGDRHVRFWYLKPDGDVGDGSVRPKWPVPPGCTILDSRPGVLGSRKDSVFTDIATSPTSGIYAVTSTGILVGFGKRRVIERWVDLKAATYGISVNDTYTAVACANGTVRLFNAKSMEYVATVPKPPALGEVNHGARAEVKDHVLRQSRAGTGGDGKKSKPVYPDAVGICLDNNSHHLACLYSDRSLFLWDIRTPKQVGKYRSFMSHNGCIWDLEVVPRDRPGRPTSALPPNTFVTCGADRSIRFWNVDEAKRPQPTDVNASMANFFSRDTLEVLYPAAADDEDESGGGEGDGGKGEGSGGDEGIRSIALSPDGHVLASGDRLGNMRVHDLRDFSQLSYQQAHDSEILSLSFSGQNAQGQSFLASGSRDRLMHIYNVNRNYEVCQTLAEHSSSITAVKFSPIPGQLVSTGADKSIVFRSLSEQGTFKKHFVAYVPHGTLYDVDIDATTRYAATAGQDKRVNIYNVRTGKAMRSYNTGTEGAKRNDWPIRVHLDPAGIYAVTCHSDKTIRLFDFYSGDCLASASGHAELITGAKFTADCRHLITVSADGCIFIWKLAASITRNINERLAELYPAPPAANNSTTAAVGTPVAQPSTRPSAVPALSDLPAPTPPSPHGTRSAVPQEEKLLNMLDGVTPRPTSEVGTGLNVRESLMPAWARSDGQDAHAQQRPATHAGTADRPTADAKKDGSQSARPVTAAGGRWAERIGEQGYQLYSEQSDLRPLVDPSQQGSDWRRFTIEPTDESEFLRGRPSTASHLEDDDDVMIGSDGEDTPGAAVSPDDISIGGLGSIEDDDEEVVLKTPREEDMVYYEDPDKDGEGNKGAAVNGAGAFKVAAKDEKEAVTEEEEADADDAAEAAADSPTKAAADTATTDATSATPAASAVAVPASGDDDGFSSALPVDDFFYREFSNLDEELPRSDRAGVRESLTANYMSQILKRSSSLTASVTSLPTEEDRQRESERLRSRQQEMALEVERTRKRLQQLGIVMKSRDGSTSSGSQGSATTPATGDDTAVATTAGATPTSPVVTQPAVPSSPGSAAKPPVGATARGPTTPQASTAHTAPSPAALSTVSHHDSEASVTTLVISDDSESDEDVVLHDKGSPPPPPSTTSTTTTTTGDVTSSPATVSSDNDNSQVSYMKEYRPVLESFKESVREATTLASEVDRIESTLRALSGPPTGDTSRFRTSVGSTGTRPITEASSALLLRNSVVESLRDAHATIEATLRSLGESMAGTGRGGSGNRTVVEMPLTASTRTDSVSMDVTDALDKYSSLLVDLVAQKLQAREDV